jgi:hypothetical protein
MKKFKSHAIIISKNFYCVQNNEKEKKHSSDRNNCSGSRTHFKAQITGDLRSHIESNF